MGDGHHEPHEGPSRRGASLSLRGFGVLAAVVAALWAAGAALVLDAASVSQSAVLDTTVERLQARVQETESVVRREAALLAQEPAVVTGARLGDWATLARGAPRLRALTLEGVADLVIVLDARGGVLAQIPPTPAVTLPPLPGVPAVTLAPLGRQPYVLGSAPIAGDPAPGLVVVGRLAARLGPPGAASGLFVLSGDRLRHATLPFAPVDGWSAATTGGQRVIGGDTWRLRPAGRLGSDVVWAGVSEAGARAEFWRTALRLVAGLPIALAVVGAVVWLVGHRARNLAGPDRHARELEALQSAAVAMGSSADLDTTASQTLQVVCAVAHIDVGLVYRVDAARGRLELVASHGVQAQGVDLVRSRPIEGTRLGDVVRTGRHQVVDLEGDRLGDLPLPAAAAEGGYRTQLALPIAVHEATWGVMALLTHEQRRFEGDELTLLQAVAHQVGLAVARATLFGEMRTKSRRLEMLTQAAPRLTATLAPEELPQRVVEAASATFEATVARLWLLDDDGRALSLRAAAGAPAGEGPGRVEIGQGLVGRIAAARAPLTVGDALAGERSTDTGLIGDDGLVAFAGVPMLSGDRLLGVLAIAVDHEHDYGPEEVALLVSLANQAAVALDNARLLTHEQTRRAYLAALLDINTKIGAMVATETVLQSIAEEAARLLDVDNAGFRVLEGDELVVAGLAGTARQTMLRSRIKIGESVSGRVFAAGRTAVVDLTDAAGIIPEHLAADRRLGYTTFLGVPLRLGGRTIGVLTFRARRGFTARDRELAEAFAGQAAVAIEHARLFQDASRRAERMRALAEVNRLVTGTLDPDLVAEQIVQSVSRLFAARAATLFRLDEATGDLVSVATVTEAGPAGRIVFPRGTGLTGVAVQSRRAVASPDVLTDPSVTLTPEAREWIERYGRRAALAAPLVVNDLVAGVLVVGDAVGRVFDDEEVQLAQAFADQSALALENARLYREARVAAERLRALEEVNRLVSSSLNVDEVLVNLARAIAQFFDAPYVSVWRLDEATGRLRRALAHGDPELASELHDELAVGEGAVGWVVQHREPISWTEAHGGERYIDAPAMRRRGLRWLTVYPIAIGDRVLGAFAVHRTAAWPDTPETASLMGSLAAQAAVALENARLYSDTSRRLAETRALLEVAEILNSTLDATRLLKRVAMKIAQVCAMDRCSIELWQGDRVVPLMSQFADGRKDPDMWRRFTGLDVEPLRRLPVDAGAVETRRPVIVADAAATDMVPREWIEAFGLKALMTVPMLRQDQVIGVVTLDYCDRWRRIEPWQVDLAAAVAGQLALSLENSRLYAEAHERLRETTTLLAVGRVLSQPDAGGDLMRRVAGEVARAFGADMVGAYLVDERRERLHPVGGHHVPKDLLDELMRRPIVLARFPWLLDGWRQGRAVCSADVLADPRFDPEWTAGLPPHSVLFAPTISHGEPVGGLFLVWWRTGHTFTPAEMRLVEGVAAQVGLAMENAELSRQTQRKLAETQTLLSVSRALSSTLDPEGLVRHLLRSVAKAIGADCVGFWMMQEDGEWLEPLAGYHIPPERLTAFRGFRVSLLKHAFYAEAARAKKPIYTSDAMNDPRIPAAIREDGPHRTQLFVPVVVKDRMIAGFAVVWWTAAREFTEGELALMEAIASQAGIALDNARLFEENRRRLAELSVLHDLSRAVTGQLDRAALVEAVRQQVARVLDARNMVVILRDDEQDDLEVALRVVDGGIDTGPPRRHLVHAVGLMSVVFATGRPLRTDDYAGACARHGVQPVTTFPDLRHWLGVPMVARDRTLGVIALRGAGRPFTEAEERLLTNIAHLAALALSSARLYEERTRAFGELAAAQDQLVRTEKLRALGEMASGVAHDFNNLLGSILGRAQLLLRRVSEPQLRRWLQVIERSALDGAQTVRRLQEFTRIRRDQPLLPVDLTEVMRDALDMTQSRWREEPLSRGLSIEARTALAPVPPILGDAPELREAFTNLILNAVDAMPGGGVLTLSTAVVDGRVQATVSDTGVGIPPAVRDKIFDPFFTTKGPQGTGLGLSMTYGIVSRHGGTIAVESQEEAGTTFRLTFPPTTGTVVAPAVAGARESAPPVRSLRCLVVDDETSVRTVLADILESAGHEVVAVADGAEAIARFAAEPFDVVLADLAMPGVSGWHVARAVKHAAPSVPVFLVTGFGVELSPEERQSHGVDAVLVKPLQIPEILDAMAEVARTRPPAGPPEER